MDKTRKAPFRYKGFVILFYLLSPTLSTLAACKNRAFLLHWKKRKEACAMKDQITALLAIPLLIALGVLCLVKPEWVWLVTESWKSRGADGPSDWFEAYTRLGGAILLAVGLFCLILFVLL